MTESAPQLVVIGASAGGVEALSTLVSTLPQDFSAPIVIAQHLDPSRSSHLHEILARRSTLAVRSVAHSEHLENGVIYVVPSDRQVEIADHTVTVHSDTAHVRPSPSIDRLLDTAAEAFGDQLIAVILTGLGNDGADGARRVKEVGGTVVIQNPQTASHPEMPLSLAPTTVDIVAELEAIGPLLKELLAGTYVPVRPDDDRRLRSILEQVRMRSGIDFSAYKEPTIRRRLQRRMVDAGCETLEEYVRFLRRDPSEYERLANSFLIKVTDFFRDTDLFAHLRAEVLPRLIEDAHSHGNDLRLWSAGCATGEEAYSLAILVSELMGHEEGRSGIRIFATDLDADAVAFARRGIYPASALKNMPSDLIERYITRQDGAFEVRKSLHSMVIFGQHDLGQRAPFPRIDLVLCRNVLIYFTPELQRRALQLFAFALRDGGVLVLGKAENTSPLPEHFTLEHPRLKIFRRQGERVLIPPSRLHGSTPMPTTMVPATRPHLRGMDRELGRAQSHAAGTQTTAERSERVLLDLPVGVVVVDQRYDILSINAAARRLLGIHSPGIGEDLIHLAYRALSGPLRDVADAALRGEQQTIIHEINSLPDSPGRTRFFEFSSFVQRAPADRPEIPDSVVVLIYDVSAREQERGERQTALEQADARLARLQEFLDESTRSVRQLLQANQELATINANLRSANDELLVGSEESQAAVEEVETLSEEQQATNEELETLNEEMQATVEELNATNEDLQARTVELQDRAAEQQSLFEALETEREVLSGVLASMADAVLVVDSHGERILANEAFTHMFGETLPPLEDGSGNRLSPRNSPQRLAARGERFTQQFVITSSDGKPRWFEASGQPLHRNGGLQGGVVVIREVTDRSLRQLQEQFVAFASHELRVPLTALTGSLQILERALPTVSDNPRLRRYVSIGLEQSRILNDMIQDLMDMVRIQAGQLPIERREIDLVKLVQQTVELARPMAADQEIRVDAEPAQLMVDGDSRRLQQVVLNLVSNAIRHGSSPEGTLVRLLSDDTEARLEIIDFGPGIAPEHRNRVFDRFYRADPGDSRGLGVGLYLVQAIVTAHGGTVQVQSPEGGGATFVVRLPLAQTTT